MRFRAHVLDRSDASLPDRHAEHGRSVLFEDPDVHLRAQRPGRARSGREPPDRYDAAGAFRAALARHVRRRALWRADLLRRTRADRSRLRAARAGRQLAIDAARGRSDRAHHFQRHPRGGRARRRPKRMLVTLGYAGWSPGQIEQELSQNAWLTVAAKDAILFDIPAEERLPQAMQLLGVDYASLQDEAGHA